MRDYPPPPRRAIRHGRADDTPTKIRRLVTREEGRRRYEERPFDPEAPRESYARPHHFAVNRERNRPAQKRSAAGAKYYVWETSVRQPDKPTRLVTKKPLELEAAKQLARIGATKGKHHRAVTTDPNRKDWRIVRIYERGTGNRLGRSQS